MRHQHLQLPCFIQSIHHRHGQIENYEAGFYLLGFHDTLRTIRRVKDFQVFSFEHLAHMRLMIA